MRTHIPNEVMQRNNRITIIIDQRRLPSSQAVWMYQEEQGRPSDESYFGEDPIRSDTTKYSIRMRALSERFPSFDIFQQLVNGNPTL